MEFLNPLFFAGMAAMSVPLIVHLLHRRKIKQVDWGAMRFLLEMLAKRRRRIFLDELLLLLVRIALIACIAFAMVRPALHRSTIGAAKGITRQGGTAAILLVDDSISASSGRAQPAFESMKKLGVAYLDSLAPGDEVSVLLMSQLGSASSDPVFDIEAVKTTLSKLKPGYVASDIPGLIEAGLNQLKRHVNPGSEIVLLTDGRKDGWQEENRPRWDDLRRRLRGSKEAVAGTRARPQYILLSPLVAAVDDNIAITAVGMDRSLVSAGQPAGVTVTLANYGHQGARSVGVQATVDGQSIDSKQVEIPVNGQQEIIFPYTFPDPGSYAVEAVLVENHDFLAADDRRHLSVQVESSLPVLLVEDGLAQGLESKLGFLQHALSPEPDKAGPFAVSRIPMSQFTPSMLLNYRAVVIGDARVLEPAMIDALERYVVGGGGVLVGLGPDSDSAMINRFWARGGEGFLPCPLGGAMTPAAPALPAAINLGHAALAGFGSRNDEAWRPAKVKSFYKLDTRDVKPANLDVLLRLDSGDPLVVERRRGLGLVALFTTSLNADWSDLPVQAAYVPLMRGIVGHLGSFITPPRNLVPGDQIIYARVKDPSQSMQGEDCAGKPLKLSLGAWEGRDAILSEPLSEPGFYSLRDPKELKPIKFAVALAPAESALVPFSDREISQTMEGNVNLFHSPEQIAQSLDPQRRQSVELWKWFIAVAVLLIFLEGWMTRREAARSVAL